MNDFLSGIPYYIWDRGALRIFEVQLQSGEAVRAYLDPTNQYSADGPAWRYEGTGKMISRNQVIGFRTIDGIPAYPEKSTTQPATEV